MSKRVRRMIKRKKKTKLTLLKKQRDDLEKYFFKFAFPCAQVRVGRGELSVEKYNVLRKKFIEKESPDKETLEKIFSPAFERIKKLAERMGKDIWDIEVLKKYWNEEHNRLIENNDGKYIEASETLKDLCKVHIGEVVCVKGNYLIVGYGNKKRAVFNFLIPDIKVGDKVRIHYAHAIEKVS